MFGRRKLKGRRIAVLAADGFEMVELAVPVAALRLAGAEVDIISLRRGRIRGVNLHEPASKVGVDRLVSEASVDDYDGLLIPGGLINPDLLRQSSEVRQFVKKFDATGKPLATICHGPWVLASARLTKGRTMTSWPGVRDDLVNAGATWVDEPVVRDGHWLTSRGPQDMKPFVQALIPFFAGESSKAVTRKFAMLSAPQRDEPPAAMLAAMKWLPRPSLRTAAVLGAIAAVYLARNRSGSTAGSQAAYSAD
jgi:protease I